MGKLSQWFKLHLVFLVEIIFFVFISTLEYGAYHSFFFCVGILRFSAIISRNMYLAYVFRIIENILIMI